MNDVVRQKVTRRLKIIRGQIDGVIKMVEDDRYCIDVSNQIMAASSALLSVNREVLNAHIDSCVRGAANSNDEQEIADKLDEISVVINKLSR